MPIGAITITDPMNQMPPLILRNIADGYSRGYVQSLSLGEQTAAGNLSIKGRYTKAFYTWDLSARIADDEALHLQALCSLQQQRYQVLGDGHLLLQDEVDYLVPETPQRSIVGGSARTIAGKPTGFGILKVMIQLDPKYQAYLGARTTDGSRFKSITFKATEVW